MAHKYHARRKGSFSQQPYERCRVSFSPVDGHRTNRDFKTNLEAQGCEKEPHP